MTTDNHLIHEITLALEDMKALDITVLDVRAQTSITDYMVIASGRSSRHVKSIADKAMEHMKAIDHKALSASGLQAGEWALIDFGDFILHVMQPSVRAFYNLENLWSPLPE